MFTVASGMISQYNISDPKKRYGVQNLMNVVSKRLKMQGFIVLDPEYGAQYAEAHQKAVSKWIHEGTFKTQQSVTHGIDNGIEGLLGMLKGENFGKAVLTIQELDKEVCLECISREFKGVMLTNIVRPPRGVPRFRR